MLGWILVVVGLIALWYFEGCRGKKALRDHQEMLNKLKQGDNYYRLVRLEHKGKEYLCRVRRWNVPEAGPGIAELWSIEGSNPDGWTQYFMWEHDKLEFL